MCEVMKDEIVRARLRRAYSLTEVNIDQDPELARQHGESIPVLLIGGRTAFKGRLTAGELERKFARLAEEWERARELEERLAPEAARREREGGG